MMTDRGEGGLEQTLRIDAVVEAGGPRATRGKREIREHCRIATLECVRGTTHIRGPARENW